MIDIFKLEEQRYLVRVNVKYSEEEGYILSFNSAKWHNKGRKAIRTHLKTESSFAAFLQQIGAYDTKEDPRTKRTLSYLAMAMEIKKNMDNVIWVWSTALSKLYDKGE